MGEKHKSDGDAGDRVVSFKYSIPTYLAAEKVLPSFGRIVGCVNDMLGQCGEDPITVRSPMMVTNIISPVKFTDEYKEKVREILIESLEGTLTEFGAEVSEISEWTCTTVFEEEFNPQTQALSHDVEEASEEESTPPPSSSDDQ